MKLREKLGRKRLTIIVVLLIIGVASAASLNYIAEKRARANFTLVGFSEERAFYDEKALTDIGPRMSGTAAERQGAAYIRDEFEEAGLSDVHMESFSVPMFEVMHAEASLVKYRPILPVPDPTAAPEEFIHTADFVMQGYSGSYRWSDVTDDIDAADGGNGSDDSLFEAARGGAIVIQHMASTSSNSEIFFRARDHGVAAIILQNVERNAELGYPPIFKSNYLLEGESEFPDIPFMMCTKAMGDTILQKNQEGWKLRLDIDVVRENREVQVVVGEIEGYKHPDELVVIGGHHDTVYNGPGAIDNTVGPVTTMELARQLVRHRPECTIRFLTFGGEEEGLFGSTEYVAAHSSELARDMRVMLNFDMSHADGVDGHALWAYMNDEDRVDTFRDIRDRVLEKYPRYSRYTFSFNHLENPSFGSDHTPFFENGGDIAGCFGSGSVEYHTRFDTMEHFNAESLGYVGRVFGTYALHVANGGK